METPQDIIDFLYDEDDDAFQYVITDLLCRILGRRNNVERNVIRTRLFTGHQNVMDILNGHPERGYDLFHMTSTSILQLRDLLLSRGLLKNTRYVTVEEQICIFLHAVGHGATNKVLAETFQHSGETISRHFRNVLHALYSVAEELIVLPTSETSVHPKIRENRDFYPYFKNVVGAVDGTHIPALVMVEEQPEFRNRKGFISQNVLAACSFDNVFTYVCAGWEGSTADMIVLRSAIDRGRFQVPEGKYFLVDSGFANTSKFLAPFPGNRYHLSTYKGPSGRQYSNHEDLYNHRHAQLRNAIEKTFGILKKRFKILCEPLRFSFPTQVKIVIACCAIHNFIRRSEGNDLYFNMKDDQDSTEDEVESEGDNATIFISPDERERGRALRDSIARQMWNDRCGNQSA